MSELFRTSHRGKRKRLPPPPLLGAELPTRLSIGNLIDQSENLQKSYNHRGEHPRGKANSSTVLMPYSISNESVDYTPRQLDTIPGQDSLAQPSSSILDHIEDASQSPLVDNTSTESLLSHDISHPPHNLRSYLGDTGCMQIFSADNAHSTSAATLLMERHHDMDSISYGLMQSYLETYFNYIYLWCPILDSQTVQAASGALSSPMLRHELALCGAHLRPPLLPHTSCIDHYRRAKGLFYANHPDNPISQLCSIMLFHWYRLDQPNLISADSNWWWIGTSIRLAQQIGLHQKMGRGQSARDRIAALAQGMPLIIDADSCELEMVTLDDFPDPTDLGATIFMHWVQLWDIAGQITKELSRRRGLQSNAPLARKLIGWVRSLPRSLQLPIGDLSAAGFNRDVYYLHLGYLVVVILIHLTTGPKSIRNTSMPAIAAASCIAGIYKVYLRRGIVCGLGPEASWYASVAILALLHARRVQGLASSLNDDIATLQLALKELSAWLNTNRMFKIGIDRLLKAKSATPNKHSSDHDDITGFYLPEDPSHGITSESSQWMDYFPSVTGQTSALLASLMVKDCVWMPFPEMDWPYDVALHLQELFEDLDAHVL
ncbi:hypothetical protein NA57DRAFT_82340 [Rhizodiscina lignyota]|uniref:Transcription factor domain-containing protein n=1 Tax=Rhizodiscina lignyota TaxID=1504668 RepID=A0A9P4HZX0_9PEZI|nr:hypothetical protein NA57DRAFT_82340 [Rhizodiscina lignyota]